MKLHGHVFVLLSTIQRVHTIRIYQYVLYYVSEVHYICDNNTDRSDNSVSNTDTQTVIQLAANNYFIV